ncbi:MAG TPA: OsmC family protein [Pirellulales bacterium]|jgi:uncharacterized OsmC-like protein
MYIVAKVNNARDSHSVKVSSDDAAKTLQIAPGVAGFGSSVNGGEFLLLAVATCYCNDLYREAIRLGIHIDSVEVEATAEFEDAGLAARNIRYRAKVASPSSESDIARLLKETDAVAEIHNTLRAGATVQLTSGVKVQT